MLIARCAVKASPRALRRQPALLPPPAAAGARVPSVSRRFSQSQLQPPALETLGEMNVTRHNFEACFGDLKRDIQAASCRFIAIDTEFTGLSPNEADKERYLGAWALCRL